MVALRVRRARDEVALPDRRFDAFRARVGAAGASTARLARTAGRRVRTIVLAALASEVTDVATPDTVTPIRCASAE